MARYLVIENADIKEYLNEKEIAFLKCITGILGWQRGQHGKSDNVEYVVLTKDEFARLNFSDLVNMKDEIRRENPE